MTYELKHGLGNLFRVRDKKSERHPDYEGKICLPDGRQMLLLGWVKEGRSGKFLSVKLADVPPPKGQRFEP